MKLYYDPISTTSRPVVLFIAEQGLDVELEVVQLMDEANRAPAYLAINPNGVVPYLVDGDFGLGESSAILKYMADKIGSPTYPTEPRARARVNEALDWFNTNFHEYFCLFTIYPHFGVPKGLDPAIAQGLIAYGEAHAPRWLAVLDRHMLGERPFVCGQDLTIADYLGAAYVTLGEAAAFDLSPYPNIRRWIGRMKALTTWDATYAGFYGLISAYQGKAQASAI